MASGSPTANAGIQPNPLHESPRPSAHTVTPPVGPEVLPKSESFRDVTPEAEQSLSLITLESLNTTVPMPQTAPEAEQILHYLSSHRAICASERELFHKRLHQTLICQIMHSEIDMASQKIMAVDGDISKFRAAIRPHVSGVRFNAHCCSSCFGKR
ncbi:hypothetical protein GGX14DRAFT_462845, partial [Mycena pura]